MQWQMFGGSIGNSTVPEFRRPMFKSWLHFNVYIFHLPGQKSVCVKLCFQCILQASGSHYVAILWPKEIQAVHVVSLLKTPRLPDMNLCL